MNNTLTGIIGNACLLRANLESVGLFGTCPVGGLQLAGRLAARAQSGSGPRGTRGLAFMGSLLMPRPLPSLLRRRRFPDLVDYVSDILALGYRASDTVSKLLMFSRRTPRRTPTADVHACIDAVIELLDQSLDPRLAIERAFGATTTVVKARRAPRFPLPPLFLPPLRPGHDSPLSSLASSLPLVHCLISETVGKAGGGGGEEVIVG